MEGQVIELVGDSTPIIVELPAGSADWMIGGVSLALSWAVIQQVARWYIRLIPWGRRIQPKLFEGRWDEGAERVAQVLLRLNPRFASHTQAEVAQILQDPVTVAQLISSSTPVEDLDLISEEYPNQKL